MCDVMNLAKPRVLLIAWDGATWDVIDSLLRQDRLPNLKQLMDTGAYGDLIAIEPLLSPILWTSIHSGKKPDKHGVFDFQATTRSVRCKRIWNIFREQGGTIGLFNLMVTWPPDKSVQGFIVS